MNFAIKKAFEKVGAYYHCFPEYGQGRKVLWDGIDKDGVKFLDKHIPARVRKSVNKTEMKIELASGSLWQIIGADNYDSLVGPNPIGIIFDEWAVSDRYPNAWDYFRPILVENGGWAVFIFTPRGRNHGWSLYQMAQRSSNWFCQMLTVEDTGVISREDIQQEKDEGMSESLAQQEFYCSFLASTDDILIPFELINQALHRDIQPSGARIAGGDCARFGDDRSAMVIRQGAIITHVEKWKNLDNVQLANKFIERHRAKFYDAIGIDVIGMPGVYDLVRNAGVPCVAVNVSENSAMNPERFYRLRDELWWKVRDMFQSGQASISKSVPEESRKELTIDIQDIRYGYKGITGQILVERKDKMKERLGFSPDLGDALCCSFAPGIEMRIPESNRMPYGAAPDAPPYDPLTFSLI